MEIRADKDQIQIACMRADMDENQVQLADVRTHMDAIAMVARDQRLFISSEACKPLYIGVQPYPDAEAASFRVWGVSPSVEIIVDRVDGLGAALCFGKALEDAGMPVVMCLGFTSEAVRKELQSLDGIPENEETHRILLDALPQIEAIEKELMQIAHA